MPDRVREFRSAIAKELATEKRVDFTGRRISSPKELVELFQVYRSPKRELFHAIFVDKEGRIIEELKGEVEKISKERTYPVKIRGKSYDVILHSDLEDGGYWVECPALPGCASQGDTIKEALEMIKDAIEGHLEVMAERSTTEAQD